MRFSVSVYADGDREVTQEEVLELADAVSALGGIASGMGTFGYGAQIIVVAADYDSAVEIGVEEFKAAVAQTSLPAWPVARAEVMSEDDDFGDLDEIP